MRAVIYPLALFCIVTSCATNGQSPSMDEPLKAVIEQKDSIINNIFESLNDIVASINDISVREGIISQYPGTVDDPEWTLQKMRSDINSIDSLILDNKESILRLENDISRLKQTGIDITLASNLARQLKEQLEQKDIQIEMLRSKFEEGLRFADAEIERLSSHVTGLQEQNLKLEDDVKEKTVLLNTAYYLVGSQQELLDKKVVYKSGFIGKTLKINENYDFDSFVKVDIESLDEIILGRQNVRIISSHPEKSYKMVMKDKKTTSSIVILDKYDFWKYSKVMVVTYN